MYFLEETVIVPNLKLARNSLDSQQHKVTTFTHLDHYLLINFQIDFGVRLRHTLSADSDSALLDESASF